MRKEWINTLVLKAREDNRIWLLVGDVGYNLVEPFKKEFPDRFINCGVAEQNMVGVATGLALSGKVVFVYSLSNFPSFRCLEQIRNDVCYHKANVKIVCSGGGLSYGALGMSHHTIQDIAIMRCLPNMTVIAPCDGLQTQEATESIINYEGACYLRLERDGEPIIKELDQIYTIGKAIQIGTGRDMAIITTGGITRQVYEAVSYLLAESINIRIVNIHTIKPLDKEAVLNTIQEVKAIMTVEEHSVVGGLGSAISEIIAESDYAPVFTRLGIKDEYYTYVGDHDYLKKIYYLTPEGIAMTAKILLGSRRSILLR